LTPFQTHYFFCSARESNARNAMLSFYCKAPGRNRPWAHARETCGGRCWATTVEMSQFFVLTFKLQNISVRQINCAHVNLFPPQQAVGYYFQHMCSNDRKMRLQFLDTWRASITIFKWHFIWKQLVNTVTDQRGPRSPLFRVSKYCLIGLLKGGSARYKACAYTQQHRHLVGLLEGGSTRYKACAYTHQHRHLVGLLEGGSARYKACAYTHQHKREPTVAMCINLRGLCDWRMHYIGLLKLKLSLIKKIKKSSSSSFIKLKNSKT
jgi:hypothetical protein